MNISILVKEFPPDVIGGTETQTMRMARELEKQPNISVTVYTKDYGDHFDDVPYEVIRVPNIRFSDFLSTLTFTILSFLLLIRDSRDIDFLHCMMVYPCGFIGYLVNILSGIPYFAWIRGGDFYFMKDHPVKRILIRHVLLDTLVLVQTEKIKSDVEHEFPNSRLRVLGNGVEIPSEMADGDDVVFVGRLKKQKGVHNLLKAMETINRRLLIVGDGPERDSLEAQAETLGIDSRFVGEVAPDEVTDYLQQGSIFVLPSIRGEGLPNAILEAMAIGLPVISTDVAGIKDAIRECETGFVVNPDDTEKLEERIRTLSCDAELRQEMSIAAREYVRTNYSWRTITDELQEIYSEISREQRTNSSNR